MEPQGQRVVMVTGGSRDIGRAVALRLAAEKPRLVLVHYDPDESEASRTLAALSERGVSAESHKVDVADFAGVDRLVREVHERLGRIDVLVNNAGIARDGLLVRMTEEDWDRVLKVNLKGAFNCTRAVLRGMVKQRAGHIVNIGSVVGQMGNAGQANYAASKAAIIGFTKSVAKEVATRGIHVNAVAPGFIDAGMTASLPAASREYFLKQIPLGRLGRAEDVAEAVYWLCSPGVSYLTGQVIHVNGGLYM